MLLARFLRRLMRSGAVEVVDAAGGVHRIEGGGPGPRMGIRLHDRALHYKLALRPGLYLGEAYMDGSLTLERGGIYDLLDLLARQVGCRHHPPGLAGVLGRVDALFQITVTVHRITVTVHRKAAYWGRR